MEYICADNASENLLKKWGSKNTAKMEIITKTLNEIMNAKRAGKVELTVKPVSKLLIKVLDLMKERGYIEYKVNKEGFGSISIKIKKLNECRRQ